MAVELGALFGTVQGDQSFENVGGWTDFTAQSSFGLQTTDVHSSASGGRIFVFSGASGLIRYNYGTADNIALLAPDITTHTFAVFGWARMASAAYSGGVNVSFDGSPSTPIPFATTLQPFRLDKPNQTSGSSLVLDFSIRAGLTGSGQFYVDDILVAIDNMTLAVDYSYQQQRQIGRISHMTVGGREAMYNWFTRPRFQLPMTFMPGSQADILNRWWTMGANLCFCLNTSDSEARWVGRAGGGSPPAQGFRAPYFNVQPAAVQLDGLSGDLVF